MKRNTLLIADHAEASRAILCVLFGQEYNILEAENGEQALMLFRQYRQSLVCMLLDTALPVKTGYQVLEEIHGEAFAATVPIVVVTADTSAESEVKVFDCGASDMIVKPFEPHVIRRRVQNIIELNRYRRNLEERVKEQSSRLQESQEALIDVLSSVVEHRSVETGQHILRIRLFTRVLLQEAMESFPEYGLDDRVIRVIANASALHDVGKIAIPDAILNKPGRLTEEEFAVMKTHTVKGCEVLASLDRMNDKEYLGYAYNICRYHHERWDGKGYPDGLAEDQIPLCAQVVGVADAYDALTTERVYKEALPPDMALTMILNGKCGAFSPRILECLKRVSARFAKMVCDYADGKLPKTEDAPLQSPSVPWRPGVKGGADSSQDRYLTMLRYADATVLDLQIKTGAFHLMYCLGSDFDSLRFGGLFRDAFHLFVKRAVHPEDQEQALELLDGLLDTFVQSRLMGQSRKYRVYSMSADEYYWCEETLLLVAPEEADSDRVLIAWKALPCGEERPKAQQTEVESLYRCGLLTSIHQCLTDKWLTLTYAGDGLLDYRRQELKDRFHNRYIELVHPEDRPGLLHQFYEQASAGRTMELEYRVKTGTGQWIWVMDKCMLVRGGDGQEYLNSVLVDITKEKQVQEELRLSLERHQIIVNQTNDIIFEWDIVRDTIFYSSNWEKKFNYEPITQDASRRVPQVSHVHPQDLGHFGALMQEVAAGRPYAEGEIRIADREGRYRWFRIRVTTQYDDDKRPVKAIGLIMDVDSERRLTQNLIEKAERDALTRLYNKSTAIRKVNQLLEGRKAPGTASMFLVDLDDFKMINGRHGHLFGDAILAEIASELKKLFAPGDTLARIGGDEFMVFSQLHDKALVCSRAQSVMERLTSKLREMVPDCPVSCSVGAVRCPEDGDDFHVLFQRADQALYRAKEQGKNRFVLYERTQMLLPQPKADAERMLAANAAIESDDALSFGTDGVVNSVLQALYLSRDVDSAINDILEMLGNKFNVSRAYIFENSEDGRYCRNTFEWCNSGITSEMANLQQVNYDEMGGDYKDNFDERGIFYCPDISVLPKEQYNDLAPQGIRSMLQCAIYNEGKFEGYVGFDDCLSHRLWTQNQIDALIFISELLSAFLMKKRAQDRTVELAKNLQIALDNQNSWIYVIDPDTCRMHFINAKTRAIAPDARPGMRCYEAFFARQERCEQCPARNIRQAINQTMEIYNPVLKVWSIADATLIRWQDKEACLLACHDITRYKTGG